MKILIDATGIINKTDGVGQYSLQLLREMANIDNKNEYVILLQKKLNKKHLIFDLASMPNFSLIKVNIPSVGPKKQIGFPLILKSQHIHCDLLHSLNSELPLLHNIKSVVTIHDLKYIKYPQLLKSPLNIKSTYLKYIFKQGARKATKIIAISESTKKDIINILKIPENKIKTIYEASNLGLYSKKNPKPNNEIVKRYKIKKPYFLYVGAKRPHKNLMGLLKAFSIFKQKYDKWNSKLVIVGIKNSYNTSSLLNEAKKINIMNDLIITGFVFDQDLRALYSEAEIFLLVSFYEGFGLPILEAMECKTPVITSNISSMPEIAGDATLLVNPYNFEEIANKMNEIMSSNNLKNELIKRGSERIKKFSWRITAEETLKIYKEILEKN